MPGSYFQDRGIFSNICQIYAQYMKIYSQFVPGILLCPFSSCARHVSQESKNNIDVGGNFKIVFFLVISVIFVVFVWFTHCNLLVLELAQRLNENVRF